MIGSSLSLCYPRIGVVDLFYLCASCSFMPLDKTYPTRGLPSGCALGLGDSRSGLLLRPICDIFEHFPRPPTRK